MAPPKAKGDRAEIAVAHDAMRRGHKVAFPYGEDATVDWIAVFDATTGVCYYVPASELRDGRALLHLRLTATRNNQRERIRWARDYLEF